MEDWIIEIHYIDFRGRPKMRRIGVHNTNGSELSEREAIYRAIQSLGKSLGNRWMLPPSINDCKARKRYQCENRNTAIERAAEWRRRIGAVA